MMGACKKQIVQWCKERQLPAPGFERISLPDGGQKMIVRCDGKLLELPVPTLPGDVSALCEAAFG